LKLILLLGVARASPEDLLMVVNYLNKLKGNFDLRDELSVLLRDQEIGSSSTSKVLDETINFRTTSSNEFFFLKHKKGMHTLTPSAALTSDGRSLFLHMNGLGVMKLSQGVGGQPAGKLKIHNPQLRSGEDISMVFIKDKLILRSSEATPYRIVDSETLEERAYKEEP